MAGEGKRIAKNTVFLYIRMFIVLLISLYTVRIVIKVLGVEDYGIYSAVGGIVLVMSFLSQTVTFAAQRYFSFELGRNDFARLSKVFNTILIVYITLAIIISLVAEFVGIWFLENKMIIPSDRMDAAHWVLHFSLLSFIASIIYAPYSAVLIAHENMKIYAYVSVIEALLKLAIVFLLTVSPIDKLVFYAALIFVSHLIVASVYAIYCAHSYKETKLCLQIDKPIMKELLGYSSWTMFGSIAGAANNQGVNLLLNSFFGPVVNTAYSVSNQIGNTLQMFSSNLFAAFRPQMVKQYAMRQLSVVTNLLYKSTKLMAILLLLVMVPIFAEIHFVLLIWLGDVADYMVDFSRLTMIYYFLLQLSNPLTVVAQAANKVKKYHLSVDTFLLITLIIAYIFLHRGLPAQSVYWSMVGIMFIAHFIRFYIVRGILSISLGDYLKKTIIPVMGILITSVVPLLLFRNLFMEGWLRFLLIIVVSSTIIVTLGYFVILDREEKTLIASFIRNKFKPVS